LCGTAYNIEDLLYASTSNQTGPKTVKRKRENLCTLYVQETM
jgi:hypothetical protein